VDARSAVVALTERMTARSLDSEELATQFGLTSREIETAQLLGYGYSTRQVAAAMGISINTARRHTEHGLLKLNVHSRAAVGARLARIS
jgi:DNA-binding CsgD family transcriptional regulator